MLTTAEHESLSRNAWEIIPLEVQESVAQSDVLEVNDAAEEEKVYVDNDDDGGEEDDDGLEEQDVCADALVEEEDVAEQKGLVGRVESVLKEKKQVHQMESQFWVKISWRYRQNLKMSKTCEICYLLSCSCISL